MRGDIIKTVLMKLIMDCVASLYGRNNAFDLVKKITEYVFVPITLGGGIRTLDDVNQAFDSGADKICLNTAAIINPDLIAKIAATAGSQAVVLSVEAKKLDWTLGKFTTIMAEKRVGGMFVIGLKQLLN